MTILGTATQDQILIAEEKVKLASGDVNSVKLQVNFDSAWDDFPARTAIFYTSQDSLNREMLLINNECTVPAEVLAEVATLFVGVRGVAADGMAVKTSSFVKYSIIQGAAGGHTIKPEMDLYRQFLAAMDAKLDPIYQAHAQRIEERMDESVRKSGDTMTGSLILHGEPTQENEAAQKSYVDGNITVLSVTATKTEEQKIGEIPYFSSEKYSILYEGYSGTNASSVGFKVASLNSFVSTAADLQVKITTNGEIWTKGKGNTKLLLIRAKTATFTD